MKSMEDVLSRNIHMNNTNSKPYLLDWKETRVVKTYKCHLFPLTVYCYHMAEIRRLKAGKLLTVSSSCCTSF